MNTGMCIGGPLAGVSLKSPRDTHRVAGADDMSVVLVPGFDPVPPVRTHQYRFEKTMFVDGAEVMTLCFWLHEDVPSLSAAFKTVFDAYAKKK